MCEPGVLKGPGGRGLWRGKVGLDVYGAMEPLLPLLPLLCLP